MADEKDNKHAASDAAAEAPNKPLAPEPKIDVHVEPARKVSGKDPYIEKVKESIKKDVQKSLDKDKSEPSKKALDNVQKNVTEAAKEIDGKKVDHVKVTVRGNAGGHPIKHESDGKPPEKKP